MKKNKISKNRLANAHRNYLQAQQFQQSGHLARAEQLYKKILTDLPGQKDSLHYLGLIYLQKGDYEKARSCLEKSLEENPNPLYFGNYGFYFQQLRNFDAAIEQYQKALSLKEDYPEAWFNLGLVSIELGEINRAEDAFKHALKYRTNYIKALYYLAYVQELSGQDDAASQTTAKLMTIKPENSKALIDLATCIREMGGHTNYKTAARFYETRLQESPRDISCALALGTLYEDVNRADLAIQIYAQCLVYEPDHYEARLKYIRALISDNRYQQAEDEIEKLYETNPNDILLNNFKGKIETIKGHFSEAENFYHKSLAVDKNNISAMSGLANLGSGKISKDLINPMLDLSRNRQDIVLEFSLGKYFNDQNDYQHAFEHYQKGNRLKFKKLGFDQTLHKKYIDSIKKLVEQLDNKKPGSLSGVPIFILGTPRSGTTLVEQIISSHPLVLGCGEREEIKNIYNKLEADNDLNLVELAESYLASLRNTAQDTFQKYTDKMPGNFMYIGLIKSLFPNASIIHCRRHPVDSCLSMYFQNFTKANEYTFDLDSLVFFYQAYSELMNYWDKKYSHGIYHVYYDIMVQDTHRVARDLLNFCGLDWYEEVMQFYISDRKINTASLWQARQPIYHTSRERWKKYQDYIPGLIEGLSEQSSQYLADMNNYNITLAEKYVDASNQQVK